MSIPGQKWHINEVHFSGLQIYHYLDIKILLSVSQYLHEVFIIEFVINVQNGHPHSMYHILVGL
jgi:hypothetical protein